MLYIILFSIILLLILVVGFKLITQNLMKPPKNYPNRAVLAPNKKILICAGDSITHGNVSHDWVQDFSMQLPDYQIFNAGVNADLSYTLLHRLDDIIALKPHHINLLIGGNDIVAQSRPLQRDDRYITFNKIPWGTQPSIQTYEANLKQILLRLKQETAASITLMSIAPIGEDRQHWIYKTVENYNQVVQKVAAEEGVTYLPLFETLDAFLQKNPSSTYIPYEKTKDYTTQSVALHLLLGWSWDKITQHHHQKLTFDNLHFNSKGGQMIQDLLAAHLKK